MTTEPTVMVHESRLDRLETDMSELKVMVRDLDKHMRNGLCSKVERTADRVAFLFWVGGIALTVAIGIFVTRLVDVLSVGV